MHELGHCFDLAHTPKGIMGRGFDDMNAVWTMWRRPPSEQNDLQLPGEKGFYLYLKAGFQKWWSQSLSHNQKHWNKIDYYYYY